MIDLTISEYVEWLHIIQNMDIWAAKEKAQEKYFRTTGKRLEIHEIMSTSEISELRKIHAVMSSKKPQKKPAKK